MKRILLLLSLTGATWALTSTTASAQVTDTTSVKPQLNTAPPGVTPPPARSQYEVTRPAVPVPAPPPVDAPLPPQRPNAGSPSGLDFPTGSRASEQPKPLQRYFIYSNFGLGYSGFNGQSLFSFSVAPALGYRVTEKFAIGPGISYSYNRYGFDRYLQTQFGYPSSFSSNNLGVKVFAQYKVFSQFFIHAEYEVTRVQVPAVDNSGTRFVNFSRTATTPLLGAGYRQQFSDRAAADIVILYNFNDGIDPSGYPLSPYGQPEIRFNFLFNIGK